MYPTRSKEASLPIERTELGYVQHTLYRQPDLYHEAVIELDSPFAAIFAADTAVFSFLVLGDQNAGKSTFLHAFTYSEDQNFLQLTSYLPILTSTFVNSRFLVNSSRAPRDELPFLDTDIARGTFLLSLEDFYFFLNENNLPLERVPETTRFALVQFIEIGGDHLDLMMHPQQSTSPHATEIAEKSLQLLRGTRKTIYFANCATLFPASPAGSGHHVLDAAALATLEQRLAFLNAQLAPGHEILFYLSRPPAALDLRASCDVAAKCLSLSAPQQSELAAASAPGLLALFRALTALLAQRHAWALAVGAVYEARHLRPDQTLDTDVLVEMVAQLFRHGMMGADRGTEPVLVAHLLRCHRTLRERVDLETGEITIWITPSVFGDYLEAQHGTEVPESLLLQQFPSVAHRLAAGGLCIAHARHNFSSLVVALASDSGRTLLTWYPAGLAPSAPPAAAKPSSVVIPTLKSAALRPSEAQVRFPLYSPLYDVIAFYAANNVPPGFWLTDESAIRIRLSGAVATRLGEVLRHLAEEEIPRQWRSLLHAPADRRASSASVLVWLLEEWHLGARLLSPAGGAHHSLPVCLPVPTGFEPSALAALFPHGAPPAPAADARPSVTVRLQSAA